ncbi:MAG TPA: DUF5309 domain-containing protein [Burkholderiales bacterium]|nr:DUF5309 domain-containing protein [Burkholderiales bacterium]
MTILTNTVTTYGVKGIREELSDVIYNISPTETPFVSNAGRDDMDNTFTEWQTDSLQSPNTSNAQLEADDIGNNFDAIQATVRLGNYAQISRKTAVVGGTEEKVKKAGRKSEMAYQVAKKSRELKRDIEAIAIGASQAANAGSNTVARTTASFISFIIANVGTLGTGGVNQAWAGSGAPTTTRTDATSGLQAFTESMLKNVLQQQWVSGGNPSTIMVDGQQKQTISGFSGIATKTYYQTQKVESAIIGAADVYVSDFGVLSIVPNRFQRHRDCFTIDFEYVKIAYLRNFRTEALAKTGDAEKRMVLAEWCVKVTAPTAQGLQPDLL